jgi:hypothetical protein
LLNLVLSIRYAKTISLGTDGDIVSMLTYLRFRKAECPANPLAVSGKSGSFSNQKRETAQQPHLLLQICPCGSGIPSRRTDSFYLSLPSLMISTISCVVIFALMEARPRAKKRLFTELTQRSCRLSFGLIPFPCLPPGRESWRISAVLQNM